MTIFGDRLAELRKIHGMTQRDLAKELHCSSGAVGFWETGERTPTTDTLLQIADLFNVSVDYLLGKDSTPPIPPWVSRLPPGMQDFLQKEIETGSPYLNLLRNAKLSGLPPASIEKVIQALAASQESLRKAPKKPKK